MEQLFSFLRTLGITVFIAFIMFFLIELEQHFRSQPPQDAPTPPYVSVLASTKQATQHSWWIELLNVIRYGN